MRQEVVGIFYAASCSAPLVLEWCPSPAAAQYRRVLRTTAPYLVTDSITNRAEKVEIPGEPTLPPMRRPLLPRTQIERADACAKADDGDIVPGPWMLIGGAA